MTKNNIASERIRMGLNQDELAERLGVSRSTLMKWETGEKAIRSTSLVQMGDLFGCSLDYLMGRSDERMPRMAV